MLTKTYGLMRVSVLQAASPVCIYIFHFLHPVVVLGQMYEQHSSCSVGNAILLPQKHINKPKLHAGCLVPISLHMLHSKGLCHFHGTPASFCATPDTKHHFPTACSVCNELDNGAHMLHALKRKGVGRKERGKEKYSLPARMHFCFTNVLCKKSLQAKQN